MSINYGSIYSVKQNCNLPLREKINLLSSLGDNHHYRAEESLSFFSKPFTQTASWPTPGRGHRNVEGPF